MTSSLKAVGDRINTTVTHCNHTIHNSWFGRLVVKVKGAVGSVAKKAQSVVAPFFRIASDVKNDNNALATFFRGTGYGLMLLSECGVSVLSKFKGRTADVVNLIDTVQVLGDAEYFLTGKWKNDSAPQLIGRLFLTVADVAGLCMWAEELGVKVFSKAGAAIGKTRGFGFVPNIPVGSIVTGFVGVGFFFLGADGAWRLYKTRNVTEAQDPNINVKRIQALFDMTWCGFEVAGKVAVLALPLMPVSAPGVVATLGVTAACFGLLGFGYSACHKDQLGEANIISDMQR